MKFKIKYLVAPFFGLFISIPMLLLAWYGISHSGDFNNITKIGIYALNTLIVVFGSALLIFFIGGISAFLVSKFKFFGSKFFSIALVLPLAFPSFIIGYTYNGLFEIEGLLHRLSGIPIGFDILNMYGCIVVFALAMYPYLFIVAKSSFASLSNSVDELVLLHNISPLKGYFKVYLPLAYPAFFIGLLLASLEVISDYGTVVYFGVETFSVAIFKQWFGYGDMDGAINISLALMIFVFIFLYVESKIKERKRYESSTFSSKIADKKELKGVKNILAFLFCFIIFFASFVLPIGVLFYWASLDFGSIELSLFSYVGNTLSLNIFSSMLIVFISFIVLYFGYNFKSTLSNISHKLSMLGYSIPGAVVGIGLLLYFGNIDKMLGGYIFGGSFFVLISAYLIRFYPASAGSILSGFSKVGSNLNSAANLYGKSEASNIFRIYFPLIKSSLFSGFLIIFIDISKELPATLLLRPFNFDTLAVRIYELSSNEMLPSVAIPSLLLLSMTIVAVLLLNLRIFKEKR